MAIALDHFPDLNHFHFSSQMVSCGVGGFVLVWFTVPYCGIVIITIIVVVHTGSLCHDQRSLFAFHIRVTDFVRLVDDDSSVR